MVAHKPNSDYSLVLINLIKQLDNLWYDGNSLPVTREISSEYSLTEPSIQYSTKDYPLVIYDIEIFEEINKEIIHKWNDHSIKCNFLFIVVPQSIKKKVELMSSDIINCLIVPYWFKKSGNNRDVVIEFP